MRLFWGRTHMIEVLQDRAQLGDVEAASQLAISYGVLEPLESQALAGEPQAMYALAMELASRNEAAAIEWMCKAVDGGYGEAHAMLAVWHRPDLAKPHKPFIQGRIRPDYQMADVWYQLAIESGYEAAAAPQAYVRTKMSDAAIKATSGLVKRWRPDLCPLPIEN